MPMMIWLLLCLLSFPLLADMNANTSMSGNVPPSSSVMEGSMSTIDNDITVANDVPMVVETPSPSHANGVRNKRAKPKVLQNERYSP